MSGREEFDWRRMRQEEDEYFALERFQPKGITAILPNAVQRLTGNRSQEQVAEILRLRSLPYPEYLRSEHWQEVRRKTLERDGHQCRICTSRKSLNVHHLTYERRGEEQARDVITLCRRCHELEHASQE
jgi:hypothetical protein